MKKDKMSHEKRENKDLKKIGKAVKDMEKHQPKKMKKGKC